jgi:hypothetical protein
MRASCPIRYALHLPVMLWYAALGWRCLRPGRRPVAAGA